MTAKLKPIEPKTISANGSRTSNSDNRPSKVVKRTTTAVALPSPHSPRLIDPDQKFNLSTKFKVDKEPSNGSENDTENERSNGNERAKSTTVNDEKIVETTSGGCEEKCDDDRKVENEKNNENEKAKEKDEKNEDKPKIEETNPLDHIPDVYKTQGTMTYSSCTGYSESTCLCSSIDDGSQSTLKQRVSYLERRNWITTERLSELRRKAQDAMKHHKIFTIRGCFYSIRKSLVQRGYVEKLDIHRRSVVNGSCQVILEDLAQHLPQRRPGETRRQHIQKCERNIMSRFLEHMPIDFLWSARKEKSDWIDMARNPNLTINKFHKSPFTTKEGLCNVLRDLHWFFEEGKSETYYPRSYNAWNQDDLSEFIDDYRLTACMSMLRFLVDRHENKEADCVYSENGQIPITSIHFALKQSKIYVRSCQHLDIDEEIERVWNHEWELYLMHYQMLTQDHLTFQTPDDVTQWNFLMDECKRCLKEISTHWPQSNLDGVFNIWIVKPSNRCRGRGILLMSDIKKIVAHVNPPVVNKGRYVVQKYIERPMIIHNCKFDIRQWFLVTSVQPLVIWMYKESYLRFSSQEYDLVNFHESVHLTNHAIQKRYVNGKRDERLPRENMWDCHTFQAYLRQIGKASMWSERIFPGMQRALIGTMLASQDTMDRRPNTFELYGADFMISEDCQPWLIEINASPDLGATTSVTARLCLQCLEDVIKVVIDYRNDPKASTGNFEMIYRQVIPPAPAYLGLNLFLKGTQVVPKNGAAKKEKPKPEVKSKIERKNSQLSVKPVRDLLKSENEKTPILSPRSLLIDSSDANGNNPLNASRKNQTFTTLNKSNKENLMKNDKVLSGRLHSYLALTRWPSKHIEMKENPQSSRKPVAKVPDSSRRHASCGPKLMSIAPPDEKKPDNTETVENDQSKIKCVGNKCGPEIESNDSAMESNKSSPRKPSQETPRVANIRAKLKPVNTLSKSARPMMANPKEKSMTNSNDYRKLSQSSLQLSRMPSKLPIHSNYYNSHFYAVGLSLRAWRSKYNRTQTNGVASKTTNNNTLKGKNV